MTGLPGGWVECRLSDIAEVNPALDRCPYPANGLVHFVPMPAVGAETGAINVTQHRPYVEVKKGYTAFVGGDVLFAKITPCMENGKMAVVPDLPLSVAFGSTEFHVLRSKMDIVSEYIYYFVSGRAFRYEAEYQMTGAVGQKRVPTSFVAEHAFPLPPLSEQHRIVAKIEALFSELDAGSASLTRARAQLKTYRQALLKAAFEGKLTAPWRAANPDKLDAPETLLSRIRTERDTRYAAALTDWQNGMSDWRAGGEVGRKPGKPSRPEWPKEFDFSELVSLPLGWTYVPFEGLAYSIRNGISHKPNEAGTLPIFRISAVRPMAFDMADFRFLIGSDEYDDFRLEAGDLVFTRYNGSRAYVGVAAVYRGDGSHVYPDKLIRCDVESERLGAGFLEKAVNCGEPRAFIESRIRTTAGQAGISGADLKAMPVPICGPQEQAEINRILDVQLSQILNMDSEITTALAKITALRQSILKKAFSGQLVAQDPADEPAAALLARLAQTPAPKPRRKTTP
ncbi:MAG: restriction endonuclease subunit S [Pseudorhodobacter sp.]|nr:restriction endonuclease subunit S [Pseudorhodobacter sp.]